MAELRQRRPRAALVALRKLAETGRARPGDDTPPELTRLFPAHDDAARTKKKAPSRGAGLPDPLFRRVVMFGSARLPSPLDPSIL